MKGVRADLTGWRQPLGRLTAKRLVGFDRAEDARWLCECACGGEKRVVLARNLGSHRTRSCRGCSAARVRGVSPAGARERELEDEERRGMRSTFRGSDVRLFVGGEEIPVESGVAELSATPDRPTRAHEYVFLLTKRAQYFYDPDPLRKPHEDPRANKAGATARRAQVDLKPTGKNDSADRWFHPNGRNERTVWEIATQAFHGAHFAVFPKSSARRCVVAGTSDRGGCGTCGAPVRRITTRQRLLDGRPVLLGADRPVNIASPRRRKGMPGHNRITTTKLSERWEASCPCEGAGTTPSVVLDPFAGAGTVGLVRPPGSGGLRRRRAEPRVRGDRRAAD